MPCKKQDDWTECNKCQRIFPKKSLHQHQSMCVQRVDFDYSLGILQSGFVDRGVLFGKVLATASLKGENVNLLEKRNIATLHTSTVKSLGLHLGSLITLHLKDEHIVRTIWPSSQTPVDSVGIHKLMFTNYKVSEGDMVALHGIVGVPCHANKVVLSPCKPLEFELTTQFLEYSTYYLENVFVYPGAILDIPYYGQMKQFSVISVEGDHGIFSCEVASQDYRSFADDFSTLNIGNKTTFDSFYMSKYSLKAGQDPVVNNVNEISMNSSNTSTYYSFFCDESTEDYVASSNSEIMFTSTPVKTDKKTNNLSGISCSRCSSASVAYYITASTTKLTIELDAKNRSQVVKNKLTYDSVGGLEKQIQTLKEMVELSLRSSDVFQSFGLTPPKGVLLYGPSGTGKSLLARTMISESGVYCITLSGPDVLSRYYGESEAKLRDIFVDAERNAPSIIFIDELDALCPKRDKLQNEFEKRVVATLLTLMDGLATASTSGVFVLAATNRPDSLDPALRRPGRFEKEIEIGIPKSSERADILKKLLRRIPHCLSEGELVMFTDNAHGYVGADLMAVVKEATMIALKRTPRGSKQPSDSDESRNSDNQFIVSSDDVRAAFQHVRPSGLREVAIDVPKVYWNDIGGNTVVKQKLKQAIEWPLKHPEAFVRMNIEPPKGILMYGPPGCSKTLIAKALATESGLNFIAVKGPEIFSKWVGESEKAIRQVFHKARMAAPCVVFFDEIDAVASKRGGSDGDVSNVSERVLTQLLTELDGVEALRDVTLVAATNRPDVIDKALMRPGRIDRIIYIPLPDSETRREIFNIQLRNTPLAPGLSIEDFIAKTKGYSGAEITAICREAALAALQEDIHAGHVQHKHFLQALQIIKPRISLDIIQYYNKFQEQCGIHCL